MFRNYLKVAIRNLVRQKIYAFINIAGLAIGMACFLLIFLLIQSELGYDAFHEHAARIYRVILERGREDGVSRRSNSGAALSPLLKAEFPAIERAVRFVKFGGMVGYGEKRFHERKFVFADPEVFDVFTFPLREGDPETALQEPFSVVLTEATARKYFGEDNPIGRMLTYKSDYDKKARDYKVTGVLKKIPPKSHIRFDFLASMESSKTFLGKGFFTRKWDGPAWNYIQLRAGSSPEALAEQLPDFAKRHIDKGSASWVALKLESLTSIYLHSGASGSLGGRGSMDQLVLFSALGFAILLIACINFINLSTARSAARSKEVGMRKVLGGNRSQLIKQFLGESLILSVIALVLATAIAEIALPLLPGAGIRGGLSIWGNWGFLLAMIGTTLFVGIGSGSYPALFLSSFDPVQVLRGKSKIGSAGGLRKVSVVVQFVVSMAMIIITLVAYQQLRYLKRKDLGFDKTGTINIKMSDRSMLKRYPQLKSELLRNTHILGVTASSTETGVTSQNMLSIRSEDMEGEMDMDVIYGDLDYIKTLGMEIIEGRGFSEEFPTDVKGAFLLNQSALKKVGWKSTVGKRLEFFVKSRGRTFSWYEGPVIGTVKDFHFRSVYQEIRPLALIVDYDRLDYLLIRIHPDHVEEVVPFIRNLWSKLFPEQTFEYSFLEDDIARRHRGIAMMILLFGCANVLGIFIACLGLFGLASYTIDRRTKEIGIRKVLGASVWDILLMLSKEFTRLVFVAAVLACPIAYYVMDKLLQNFAYRAAQSPIAFILGLFLTLSVALLTVNAQAIRAALANPVDALRYE